MGPVVMERDDDDFVALLLGNAPAEGTKRHAASTDATLEVRIDDVAVVHTPDEVVRRRRGAWYVIFAVAAAAVALLVGLVPRLVQSSSDAGDQLAVSPLRPTSPAKPAPAQTTAMPPRVHPHAVKLSNAPRAHVPVPLPSAPPAPPAPLAATVSLSAAVVHAGGSITVHYSWTDGSGQLLYVNHVGVSATKFVRLPPCGTSSPAPKASAGHGSWTFALPVGGPVLIEGVSLPFDHPERIRVGVQIGTGGRCGAVEEKTVTQWVTLYPAVVASPSTTP